MSNDIYENPLITRYASAEMAHNFSDKIRYTLWRKLWLALAESERELGVAITKEQLDELSAHLYDIDFDIVREREKAVRHDVMAHIYAYGLKCPTAAPIIHLGATSCYVTDNSDLIIYRDALNILKTKLVNLVDKLSGFAYQYRKLPTLGFTHLQSAQLVTVGKRATLWIQDLLLDISDLEYLLDNRMLFRGVKGTTGTMASFMDLFDNDYARVKRLNELVSEKMGFSKCFAVSGQTYTRKLDYTILALLSSISQSAAKFASDLRILQSMKELEEPFEKGQVGSSAMAYKRNPMRSERVCSLARFVQSLPVNAAFTASTQGLERTLDDSANRRIVMAQAFLAVDGILNLYLNISGGIVVYDKVIAKHIAEELPFMATEVILMEGVKAGGNRQALHERIRVLSMEAGRNVKVNGGSNNLLQLIKQDPAFAAISGVLDNVLQPTNFIGACEQQVLDFLDEQVEPILNKYSDLLGVDGEVNV